MFTLERDRQRQTVFVYTRERYTPTDTGRWIHFEKVIEREREREHKREREDNTRERERMHKSEKEDNTRVRQRITQE